MVTRRGARKEWHRIWTDQLAHSCLEEWSGPRALVRRAHLDRRLRRAAAPSCRESRGVKKYWMDGDSPYLVRPEFIAMLNDAGRPCWSSAGVMSYAGAASTLVPRHCGTSVLHCQVWWPPDIQSRTGWTRGTRHPVQRPSIHPGWRLAYTGVLTFESKMKR